MIKKINFYMAVSLIVLSLKSEVLVITHACKKPEYIKYQVRTLQKFMLDPYTFVVFNDATDKKIEDEINNECQKYNISCIRIPQNIHQHPYLKRWPGEDYNSACVRCANVVQYSLNELGFTHDDWVMIIDSDMFLIKEFSLIKFMRGYQIAGVPQSRAHVNYLWNGLVFMDMAGLPERTTLDFNCGKVDGIGVDVGGQVYNYLKSHPDVKVKELSCNHIDYIENINDQLSKINILPSVAKKFEEGIKNVEFVADMNFFHYRGGTNWDSQSPEYHKNKWGIVKLFLNDLLGK